MSGVADDIDQLIADVGLDSVLGAGTPPREKRRREEAKAAAEARKEARNRLIPIKDPNASKADERKKAARRRTSGRASTILSQEKETLG